MGGCHSDSHSRELGPREPGSERTESEGGEEGERQAELRL